MSDTKPVTIKQVLDVDDLFRAAELIGAALSDMDPAKFRKAKDDAEAKRRLGMDMFRTAFRVAPQQGKAFVAGICDVSPEEFGRMPATTVLDVIEDLSGRSDLRDFFTRALDMARRYGLTSDSQGASDSEPQNESGPRDDTG